MTVREHSYIPVWRYLKVHWLTESAHCERVHQKPNQKYWIFKRTRRREPNVSERVVPVTWPERHRSCISAGQRINSVYLQKIIQFTYDKQIEATVMQCSHRFRRPHESALIWYSRNILFNKWYLFIGFSLQFGITRCNLLLLSSKGAFITCNHL